MLSVEERAQAMTGCVVNTHFVEGLQEQDRIPFCETHEEDGNPAWSECRWAILRDVLIEERKQALLEAADWIDLDPDQGGPSYYVDAPAVRLAYYEHGWAAEHLRHRANEEL